MVGRMLRWMIVESGRLAVPVVNTAAAGLFFGQRRLGPVCGRRVIDCNVDTTVQRTCE